MNKVEIMSSADLQEQGILGTLAGTAIVAGGAGGVLAAGAGIGFGIKKLHDVIKKKVAAKKAKKAKKLVLMLEDLEDMEEFGLF